MVAATYFTPQPVSLTSLEDAFNLVQSGFNAYNEEQTHPRSERPSKKVKSYQPDVDLYESSAAVIIEVSLPGVQKSDINLEYDHETNQVIVTGESSRVAQEDRKTIKTERPTGKFERVIGLNKTNVLSGQISATVENGILTLTVPKNLQVESKRKINIL